MLAVLERRAEIGLRSAVGARASHIAALIVSEAGMVGTLGGVVGFVFDWSGLPATSFIRWRTPVLDPLVAPYAALGGVVVGVIGGALAACRAMRITPQDALRL